MSSAAEHRPWYRSLRFWISVLTFVLVGLVIAGAWEHVRAAFESLTTVNLGVLALLIPVQLASFWFTGEVLFSYLRGRGELHGMHPAAAMRMSLEFNFANHMLPSGGAAGIAYTNWKLSTLGVPASRTTLAQLTRFALTFVSFVLMLAAAALWLLLTHRGTLLVMVTMAIVGTLALVVTVGGAIIFRRRRLLHRIAGFIFSVAYRVLSWFGRQDKLNVAHFVRFVDHMYREFAEVTAKPRALLVPFLLSFAVNALDASLFLVALASFGYQADFALVFVAYGAATVASMVIVTPNGLGAYEVVMVSVLAAGGVPGATAIAAIALSRVILLLGTILFGYGFYQHSVIKSGSPKLTELPEQQDT
ncbi:lysylphosphatidylglycerol synthase transmembrane domain-containing protein [Glutamicibacter sp. PS]|uniref:lysylphosphatidylglycerol synthase transmembrane domain-containing protein n=1 Tax=Glutamicibacter sp. PS TaxID=3075634 RepID=UPI00284AA093|nr:lysylphosphatidylglycerol synthase transmembrane domain-containing protein [Glutamicibacter sp. PS]MDR4533769.1 flippase-like domain-containing protein [Glutamicibacter sp. PS]